MTMLFPELSVGAASSVNKPKSSSFQFRDYQSACSQAVRETLEKSSGCLAILATGLGKTEIAADLIGRQQGGSLYIVPLKDLCRQASQRLRLRGVPCGVEQGSLRSSEQVTVACYASLLSRNRYQQFLGGTRLIIVDESHMNFTPRSLAMLQQFREDGCKIVGMTASPDRLTGDPLTAFYGEIAFNYSILEGVRDGWLVPPRLWLTVAGALDLSKFKSGFGDYSSKEVSQIMAHEANVQTVCQLVETTHDKQPSLVFCSGIFQAQAVQEGLQRRGVEAAIVHSRMEDDERKRNLDLFENGDVSVILNIGCLTLGYDFPPIKKVYICKPTKSRNKYIQMFGRGTRALPGVLDGTTTVEERKAAIAKSDKSFFEVYDLTDTSRHCDLQTGLSVMQPELDPALARRVRKRQEASTGLSPANVDEIVAEEAKAAASEAAALHALDASRRAALVANGQMRHYQRDAFGQADAQRPASKNIYNMTFGKYKGQPIKQLKTGYIRWLLENYPVKGTTGDALRKELAKRKNYYG